MITVEHITRTDEYSLTDNDGRRIYAYIENGHITLETGKKGNNDFTFMVSKPEVVYAMGLLIMEAAKIVLTLKEPR